MTIVVAVYNGATTIAACVSSLLTVRYPRECLEIVVVDNGSTDDTLERLRPFGDGIRVLHEPRVAHPPRATRAFAPLAVN